MWVENMLFFKDKQYLSVSVKAYVRYTVKLKDLSKKNKKKNKKKNNFLWAGLHSEVTNASE